MKWALEQFRPYILSSRTKVVTDHANLKWLTTISPKQSKIARWCIVMAEYDFFIKHKPGIKHIVPDTLSRVPMPEPYQSLVTNVFLASLISFDIHEHAPKLVKSYLRLFSCLSAGLCLSASPQVHRDSLSLTQVPVSSD